MQTNRISGWSRIALIGAVIVSLGGRAEAASLDARLALGVALRKGDWVAFEPLGLIALASDDGANLALTVRGVAGLGGAGGALGFGTGLGGHCIGSGRCGLRESMFGTIVGVEARVERTYAPGGWRPATYGGPQLTYGGVLGKTTLGWMFDVHDRSVNHFQFGFGWGW